MIRRVSVAFVLCALAGFARSDDDVPSLSSRTRGKLAAWFGAAGAPRAGESFGDYLVRAASVQRGVPYEDVATPPGHESLRVDLDEFECVSFIESSLAVARCGFRGEPTESCFERELVALRYRGGALSDYASRLHYFDDWVHDNESRGRVHDLTAELGGEPVRRDFFYITSRVLRHASLPSAELAVLTSEMAAVEARLSAESHLVLSREHVPTVLPKLENGDLIGFVRERPGLLVHHAGFVYWVKGTPRLLHASSYHKRVVVTPEEVTSYLDRRPERRGIIVVRPLAPL